MQGLVKRVKNIDPVKKVLNNSYGDLDWKVYVFIACEFENYLKEKGLEVGEQERSLFDVARHKICDPLDRRQVEERRKAAENAAQSSRASSSAMPKGGVKGAAKGLSLIHI